MIVDCHNHIFEKFEYMDGVPPEEMIKTMDSINIDKSVIFTVKGFFGDSAEGNDELLNIVRNHPDRFIAFGTVHPREGEKALQEMERSVKLGIKGFKFQSVWQGFFVNTPAFYPIMEKLRELKVPAFIHSGTPPTSEPFQIINIARMYPDVPVILAHTGLPDFWEECVLAAKRFDNIYFETAGAQAIAMRTIVNTVGPERLIFGSDSPFGGLNNQYYQLENVRLAIPEKYHDLVLGGNAARIIGV